MLSQEAITPFLQEHVDIFGLSLYAKGRDILLERWAEACTQQNTRETVFFVNAHTVNTMYEQADFLSILRSADVLLPDGIGIDLAVRGMGKALEENLCGTDLALDICRHRSGFRIFLVGGRPGVAEAAAARFSHGYGGNIVGVHHGFLAGADENELGRLWEKIAASRADMVWVGMGVPLQERWVWTHRGQIDAPLVFAVGGLFDYYAGCVKRAPLVWRKLRMEWVYRLIQEPTRLWKRYVLGNPLFLMRLLHLMATQQREFRR
ncbi:MAG: WecB/TagA/CpsF family glycosyltransferase [Myxococcales bacterium]|nr:WecB/TagA/CpsF family glycosyltransferase [Myxococcales bacterium]MCB9642588.1 WecB/TagA/CpsF family glycosyltransferase [Myxococcales bacterium]